MALLRRGVPLLKRGFASEVSVADSPFLRFGNPAPTSLDLTPLLSSVPETEVGLLFWSRMAEKSEALLLLPLLSPSCLDRQPRGRGFGRRRLLSLFSARVSSPRLDAREPA